MKKRSLGATMGAVLLTCAVVSVGSAAGAVGSAAPTAIPPAGTAPMATAPTTTSPTTQSSLRPPTAITTPPSAPPLSIAGPSTNEVPSGVAHVPGEITQVAVETGFEAASLTWTVPANAGFAIKRFTIVPSLNGAPESPIVVPVGTAGSLVDPTPGSVDTDDLSGLVAGGSYTFTISASNAKGAGPASTATSTVVPTAAASASYAPKRVVAVASFRSAKVRWIVPENNGSPITSFEIIPYVGTTAMTGVPFAASTPGSALDPTPGSLDRAVVPGLARGTHYTFTVLATNGVADSLESAASSAVNPTDVPGVVATLQAATTSSRKVKVSWTVPTSNGRPVTSFTLQPYVGSTPKAPVVVTVGAVSGALSPTAGAKDSHVLNLSLGHDYTVTVTATNVNGPGAESAPSNAVSDTYVPLAPTRPTAAGSPFSAVLGFTTPSNGGSPITQFVVWAVGSGGTIKVVVPVGGRISGSAGAADTYRMTGLHDGQNYRFVVAARNAIGTGAQSSPSNLLVNLGEPGTPTNVSAVLDPADGCTLLNFTVPSNGGGTFTKFTIGFFANGAYQGVLGSVTVPNGQSPQPGSSATICLPYPPGGIAWQFNVTASATGGDGPPSAPSNPVYP